MDAYRAAWATATVAELTGRGEAAFYVRQAALETVIADRMRVNATISIHRALLAGASVEAIAHVLGSSSGEIVQRWRGWADGQRRLNTECRGLGLSPRDYDQVAAGVEAAASDEAGMFCCRACRAGIRK